MAVIETKNGSHIRLLNKETVLVDPSSLLIHEANPRQGDVGAIAVSFKENGFYGAVVVDARDSRVLAGNHRVMAAKSLGMERIPVQMIETDGELHAIKILLADNRHSDLATYDDHVLVELLSTLAGSELGLLGTGYDGNDLDDLLRELGQLGAPEEAPEAQVDKAEELRQKWGVEYGQLWQVGRHRVLCGDSTRKDDVERLVGGDKIGMIFTDPPFDFDDMTFMDHVYAVCPKDCHVFVMWSDKRIAALAARHIKDFRRFFAVNFKVNVILSGNMPVTMVDLVAEFNRGKGRFQNLRDAFSTYIECPKFRNQEEKVGGNHGHPQAKNPELPKIFIEHYTKKNDVVLDVFSGSGSTLVAAYESGRIGYGLELDPGNVAITLDRFHLAGVEPELVA